MKQEFFAQVKKGKLDFYNKEKLALWLIKKEGKEVDVLIEEEANRRTKKQNNAIHLYCQLLADEFEEHGLDMKQVIHADIPPTMELVKENIWRKVQEKMFGKKSTTQLTTDEVSRVYEVINKAIGQEWGIHIPFPSIENLIYD